MILATMAVAVSLLLSVQDMKGMTLEGCKVRPGDDGRLTLLCSGNEPILLDYRLGPKENYPKFKVQLDPEGKVERVLIKPAREVDWRPLAYTFITLGALLMWHGVWQDDVERPVSPCQPGR